MTSIIIFITTMLSVIAIGMQTIAISKNQIILAAFCSSIVAIGALFALKLVPQTTNYLDYIAYIAANFIGIFVSFKIHHKVTKKDKFKKPFDFCNNIERKCEFREDGFCSESKDGCPVYITFTKHKTN
jgi:cytochrome c biogenesis protein CcdA